MANEQTIYDYGFDYSLNKVLPNNSTGVVYDSTSSTSPSIATGGVISNDGAIQVGRIQKNSNLAPFDIANDGIGTIRRVGAIKLASAGDLGVSTLSPAPTANKVIYASGNDLHVNVPTTSAKVWLDVNGSTFLGTGADAMTYAATISLTITNSSLHTTTTTAAVGDATINASGAGVAGQVIYIIITNDATAGRTITFGTNFKPNGTLLGTVSKSAVITFISDGSNLYEVSRTTGL